MAKKQPSITEALDKNSPIFQIMKEPQLMHVKVQNYGLKQLFKRLSEQK